MVKYALQIVIYKSLGPPHTIAVTTAKNGGRFERSVFLAVGKMDSAHQARGPLWGPPPALTHPKRGIFPSSAVGGITSTLPPASHLGVGD